MTIITDISYFKQTIYIFMSWIRGKTLHPILHILGKLNSGYEKQTAKHLKALQLL